MTENIYVHPLYEDNFKIWWDSKGTSVMRIWSSNICRHTCLLLLLCHQWLYISLLHCQVSKFTNKKSSIKVLCAYMDGCDCLDCQLCMAIVDIIRNIFWCWRANNCWSLSAIFLMSYTKYFMSTLGYVRWSWSLL